MDTKNGIDPNSCVHSPSERRCQLLSIWDFLIHLPKFTKEASIKCAKCNTSIIPPNSYYDGTFSKLYFWVLSTFFFVFVLVWDIGRDSDYYNSFISIFLVCFVFLFSLLLDKIISSVILARNAWKMNDGSIDEPLVDSIDVKCAVQSQKRRSIRNTYRLVVLFLLTNIHLRFLLLFLGMLELFGAILNKNAKKLMISSLFLIYGLSAFFLVQRFRSFMVTYGMPIEVLGIITLTCFDIDE